MIFKEILHSCLNFPYEPIRKTFEDFLAEVNYGAMEKDTRISDITEKIKLNMKANISKKKLFDSVDVLIVPKSKNPVGKYYVIEWELKVRNYKSTIAINNGGWITKSPKFNNQVEIVIEVLIDLTLPHDTIVTELMYYVSSGLINESLRHEVKHLVDIVDNKFNNDNYHSEISTDRDKIKYISQHSEIESQLISVLSDLEYQHNNIPNCTLEQALHASKVYQRFVHYITPDKRNKYKQKIVYFWYQKYEAYKIIGAK